jgi:hypothetical protein
MEMLPMDGSAHVLFCNCTYAKVIPPEVKSRVLEKLSGSKVDFHAVADLCDMSARRDPALQRIAESGNLRIAACFPRAVRWLFHAAGAPLGAEGVEVLNMRTERAEDIISRLLPEDSSGAECCS